MIWATAYAMGMSLYAMVAINDYEQELRLIRTFTINPRSSVCLKRDARRGLRVALAWAPLWPLFAFGAFAGWVVSRGRR